MSTGKVATTYGSAFADPRFAACASFIPVPASLDKLPYRRNLRDELILLIAVLVSATRARTLLLFSSRGHIKPELLAIILIGFLPRGLRPKIALYGEMYEPDPGLRGMIQRTFIRLADRAISRYIVFSQDEGTIFPTLWGVDPSKVRACRFYMRQAPGTAVKPAPPPGRHIFAGGNSFRDYEALLQAAVMLPEYEFVIATTKLAGRQDMPPNVRIEWPSKAGWNELISSAAIVVVPLCAGLRRSAGLLTFLDAMWHRQLVVVNDVLAVREYVCDGETGLVVDGTPESYTAALRWALDPANATQVERIRDQAYRAVCEQFTLEQHVSQLLIILSELSSTQTDIDAP